MKYIIMIISKSMEVISTSIKRFVFTVVLSVLGVILMTVTIYFSEDYWNFEKESDRALKQGIKGTYTLGIKNDSGEPGKMFENIIEEYPDMIEGIGFLENYETTGFSDMVAIRKNKYHMGDKEVNACRATTYSLNLADIKLAEGRMLKMGEMPDDPDVVYGIYLGNAYEDIPIGTEYVVSKKYNYKTVVLGRLEKGVCTPDVVNIASTGSVVGGNPYVNLDYGYIQVSFRLDISYPMFMSIGEGYTFDEVKSIIDRKSKEYDCVVDIAPLSNLFDEYNYSNAELVNALWRLMVVVLFVVTALLVSIQVVAVLKNRDIYGVYVVSGMSNRDIRRITVIENVIRVCLVFIISYALVMLYLDKGIPKPAAMEAVEILYGYVFWKVALIELGVTVVSTIVPLAVLGRYTPVRLIEEIK